MWQWHFRISFRILKKRKLDAVLCSSYSHCNRVWMLETFQPSMLNLKKQTADWNIIKVFTCGNESIDVSFRGQGQISNGFLVFPPADGLPALAFSISSLTLIGMLAVITYTVSWDWRQVVDVVSCVQWSYICRVIKANHPMGGFPNLASPVA